MKIGVDITKLKNGSYIVIEKDKFLNFMNIIKNKNNETYNKVIKYLNISELEIKE